MILPGCDLFCMCIVTALLIVYEQTPWLFLPVS